MTQTLQDMKLENLSLSYRSPRHEVILSSNGFNQFSLPAIHVIFQLYYLGSF
jgi:hypothetical protein